MMLRMKSTVFVVMVLLLADEVAVNAEGIVGPAGSVDTTAIDISGEMLVVDDAINNNDANHHHPRELVPERGDCENAPDFLYKFKKGKDCTTWAPKKENNCRKVQPDTGGKQVKFFCPQQCKDKCVTTVAPTIAPSTFEPTDKPSDVPTASPTGARRPLASNQCELFLGKSAADGNVVLGQPNEFRAFPIIKTLYVVGD